MLCLGSPTSSSCAWRRRRSRGPRHAERDVALGTVGILELVDDQKAVAPPHLVQRRLHLPPAQQLPQVEDERIEVPGVFVGEPRRPPGGEVPRQAHQRVA
jgi:hypothetical protein